MTNSKTPLERQMERATTLLDREGLVCKVLARPEVGSLIVQREWSIAGASLAMQRGFTVDTLTPMSDRDVAALLVEQVGRMDAVLVRRAMPMIIGRARSLRMTYGDVFEDVSL